MVRGIWINESWYSSNEFFSQFLSICSMWIRYSKCSFCLACGFDMIEFIDKNDLWGLILVRSCSCHTVGEFLSIKCVICGKIIVKIVENFLKWEGDWNYEIFEKFPLNFDQKSNNCKYASTKSEPTKFTEWLINLLLSSTWKLFFFAQLSVSWRYLRCSQRSLVNIISIYLQVLSRSSAFENRNMVHWLLLPASN